MKQENPIYGLSSLFHDTYESQSVFMFDLLLEGPGQPHKISTMTSAFSS